MPRYLILIAYESSEWDTASDEVQQTYYDDHNAFSSYVAQHGIEHSGAALADRTMATTVRHSAGRRDGDVSISEGPFAETAEQIGGYYDVELPDLDHAIAAAQLLPARYTVEIRPTITIE